MRKFGNVIHPNQATNDLKKKKDLRDSKVLQRNNIREEAENGLKEILHGVISLAETQFITIGWATSEEESEWRLSSSASLSTSSSIYSNSDRNTDPEARDVSGLINKQSCHGYKIESIDRESGVLFTEIRYNKRNQEILMDIVVNSKKQKVSNFEVESLAMLRYAPRSLALMQELQKRKYEHVEGEGVERYCR
jgi:hypothetical protein